MSSPVTTISIEDVVEECKRRQALIQPAVAKDIRTRAGLSQEEMGAPIDVTGPCISRWETGSRRPRGPRLAAYAALLAALDQEMSK